MNQAELIAAARGGLGDEVLPYLYSNDKLVRWYNNAIDEACIRTRGLQDDSSAVCRVPLVPGQSRYDLDQKILVVRAAHVPGRREPLVLAKASTLDSLAPGWSHQAQSAGMPRWAVFDVGQKTITLHPPPVTAGVMALRVWRLPLEEEVFEVGDDDAEPALALANPETLKHWVLFEAFREKDGELNDPQRAEQSYSLFEAFYGPRPSNHDLALWSTSRVVGQRMQSEF